jgi:hypothetical protein
MRFILPALLLTIACAHPERDLAQCKVVVAGAPGRLAACLVSQHNWDPDTAAQAELAYDASIRARIMRARSESVWVADTLVPQYRRYMQGRNALLRVCVARYAVAYNRDGVTPRPHGNESPIDAMVRVCTARFPDADQYPLSPGFFDSLAIIAGTPRRP